jgi:HEAT repeat protein
MTIRPAFLFGLAIAAMLMNVRAVLCQPAPRAGQESRIAAEIVRLGSQSRIDCAAFVKALVTIGKPAAPALVEALGDPRSNVRAFAAEALRSILAADPTYAPHCHEKAFWERRLAQLKSGMPLDEALKVLLPELSPPERQEASEGGTWSGGSGTQRPACCDRRLPLPIF